MTQQEQFLECLEAAQAWMSYIQERLKANDITQGPRDALEARLRETERIQQLEPEGRLKVDQALVAAESLLQSTDEELRNHTHARLKELKGLWDETCTYIIHCHSRIEWVWLHWSEYLKAYEEFEVWLQRQRRGLDVQVELQLGVKEKLWQVDQQRVLLSDVYGQAQLLERLLDEASALHGRTQDPSVDAQAQERLQEAYNTVRDRAEERLSVLEKMAEEHQSYQACVQRFQSWLLSKTKELTDLMDRDHTADNKLKALQALDEAVACEEKTLQHLEGVAEAVRANTSPGGAEAVVEQAEELRLGWQRLRQGLCEAQDGLRSSLDSHSQYVARCQRLGEDIGRLRLLLLGLDQQLVEGSEAGGHLHQSEENMVGQWRKYTVVRNTVVGEESQVELLKAQLKDLFRFSEDSRHLSDDVLAVVKEHQSVKCRATRLCSESESGLRSLLQDPLLVYSQWSHRVSHLLETSADPTDFSHIAMLLQGIERLLKDSAQLQERLGVLQEKGELLEGVFGADRCEALQDELSAAARNRELLHSQLLQRKSRLQGLISRTKGFDEAFKSIRSKLDALQDRLVSAEDLQPDILAKKSKSDQLRVLLRDLEDSEAQLLALETLVSSSQSNRTSFDKLCADWKHLQHTARVKVSESEEDISVHEGFHSSLLNLEKWLMIMKQKLESFYSPAAQWSVEGRQHEAQRALAEFPEKELQLQQMEAQGQAVLQRTSQDGRVHIQRDMKRLRDSWLALYNMSLNLHRLLNSSTQQSQWDSQTEAWSPGTELSLEAQGGALWRGQAEDRRDSSGAGRGQGVEGEMQWQDLVSGQDSEHTTDGRRSFKVDEVDSSDWSVTAGQKASTGSGAAASGGGSSSSSLLVREQRTGGTQGSQGSQEALGGGLSPAGEAQRHTWSSAKQPSSASTQHTEGYTSRRMEFEAWLSKQNGILSEVLRSKAATLSQQEVKARQEALQGLRSELGWGQEQFTQLLQEAQGPKAAPGATDSLEELRYRWMLYKSKLKEVADFRVRTSAKTLPARREEPAITARVQKKAGLCQRVCRVALPLWLFLLAVLLLAFLLPLMEQGSSCSLSNNFARSFNIMLRYDGPPPT